MVSSHMETQTNNFLEQNLLVTGACLHLLEFFFGVLVFKGPAVLLQLGRAGPRTVGICLCGLTGKQSPYSFPLGLKDGRAGEVVETCWLPLETLASGLASREFATPLPASSLDDRARAGAHRCEGCRLVLLFSEAWVSRCRHKSVKAKFHRLL